MDSYSYCRRGVKMQAAGYTWKECPSPQISPPFNLLGEPGNC